MQELADPTDFGDEINADKIILPPKMMNQSVTASELLNELVCSCEDGCSTNCTCEINNQHCTAVVVARHSR